MYPWGPPRSPLASPEDTQSFHGPENRETRPSPLAGCSACLGAGVDLV